MLLSFWSASYLFIFLLLFYGVAFLMHTHLKHTSVSALLHASLLIAAPTGLYAKMRPLPLLLFFVLVYNRSATLLMLLLLLPLLSFAPSSRSSLALIVLPAEPKLAFLLRFSCGCSLFLPAAVFALCERFELLEWCASACCSSALGDC